MKKTNAVTICIMATMLAVAGTARATVDEFWDAWSGGGMMNLGEGTGYNGGHWYSYNNGWYAQWFYDHPLDYTKWKEIKFTFRITAQNDTTGAEIAINWSKPAWSEKMPHPNTPPLPPVSENQYIGREVIWSMDNMPFLEPQDVIELEYEIPDYNPEWVSVDVRGTTDTSSFILAGPYEYNDYRAILEHNCVPEPATICLLGLGGLLLCRRKSA